MAFSTCERSGRGNITSQVPPTSRDPLASPEIRNPRKVSETPHSNEVLDLPHKIASDLHALPKSPTLSPHGRKSPRRGDSLSIPCFAGPREDAAKTSAPGWREVKTWRQCYTCRLKLKEFDGLLVLLLISLLDAQIARSRLQPSFQVTMESHNLWRVPNPLVLTPW